MKRILAGILAAVLLSSCQTTAKPNAEMQAYCPDEMEWPSDLSKPKVIKSQYPRYRSGGPNGLRDAVRACLSVRVDEAGNVTDVQVVRADTPEFAAACVDALKGWRFEPAKRGSTPVAATFRLSMSSM